MKSGIGILLIFIANTTYAQSKSGAFFKLSGPEKCWTVFHPFSAGRAWKITRQTRERVNQLQHHEALDTFHHGGRLDAFRHAFWMARLTQDIGPRKARSLGKAHEKGNYMDFKRKKGEDGVIQDSTATVMDLLNNETGIRTGRDNPEIPANELADKIIDMIKSGQLTMLKRNKEGQLCTCNGEVVKIPTAPQRPWALSFCLVPSDH